MATQAQSLSNGWKKYTLTVAETLTIGDASTDSLGRAKVYVNQGGGGSLAVKGVVPGLTSAAYVNLPYQAATAAPGTFTASGTAVTTSIAFEVQLNGLALVLDVTAVTDTVTVYVCLLREG